MAFNPVVYFISTEYLKQNTSIEQNVDDSKLTPFIIQAEQLYLQQNIGATGLDALRDGIVLGTLTIEEDLFIRNYIQPMVCQWAYYLALPYITYKSTNKSLSKESSEYSQPVDLSELQYMRNTVRDVAEFYTKRMVNWLLFNPGVFIWYSNPDSKDVLPKTNQAYFSGMYQPYGVGLNGVGTWIEPFGSTSPCSGCGGWIRGNKYY
jgi:hypothetical protein